MYSSPLAYFITFTLHGSWLHGDERGSYRRGGKYIAPDQELYQQKRSITNQAMTFISNEQREVIENAIIEICRLKQWHLHEVNVRTNHVHLVVTAKEMIPERVMADLKARATFRMRKAGFLTTDQKLWTEHGSTVYLFTENNFLRACEYVRDCQ